MGLIYPALAAMARDSPGEFDPLCSPSFPFAPICQVEFPTLPRVRVDAIGQCTAQALTNPIRYTWENCTEWHIHVLDSTRTVACRSLTGYNDYVTRISCTHAAWEVFWAAMFPIVARLTKNFLMARFRLVSMHTTYIPHTAQHWASNTCNRRAMIGYDQHA
jgi:hypothetical protein